jgi:hypothetical protein
LSTRISKIVSTEATSGTLHKLSTFCIENILYFFAIVHQAINLRQTYFGKRKCIIRNQNNIKAAQILEKSVQFSNLTSNAKNTLYFYECFGKTMNYIENDKVTS